MNKKNKKCQWCVHDECCTVLLTINCSFSGHEYGFIAFIGTPFL